MSRRTSGDDNTSSAGMVRDAAWNFGESVDGSRQKIKCVFCGKVINGGITRLKEHLGHVKGNVAKCDQVSSEVRRNMEQMLQQMKKNKMEKKRRDIIIEEEITRATLGGDEEYEEEEDFQATLRRSRFEADLEYEQNMYRATHHEYYHEGGSSRQQPSRAMGRSYSLNVRGSQGSYGHVPSSTPSERLAAMNVSLEREQQMKKQTKINTGTKAYKSLKGKLRKAWGNWITHNKVQFSAIESPFTKPLMTAIREVGDRVPPPTAYELSEVYLKEQYQSLKEWIGSLSPQWKQWGVTIMCDGWTGPTKMHLINFLIYSKCGTVFHKSVDATHVPSKDADYYFMLMKKVVEEVGPEIVVQVVTDNEAAIKAGGKKLMQEFPHLYWTGCAAHCLDLILADISKKSSIHKILEMAQSITQFIYRYDKVVAIMLQFTNDRQLLRPGITRFATNFIALDSIVKHKNNLRNMWESEQWKRTKYGQMNDDHATKVRDIILQLTEEGRKFWTKANEVLKVQEPLVKVLRLVDGDDKPTMGFLYEAMERAKLAIKDNCRYWGSYWKIIDNRWNFQLHHDLHAAGYFLNPQFAYGNHGNDIREDREVMRGLKKVIQRLEPNIDNQIQAFNENIEKLEKVVKDGNYYGAQQMYKSISARYVSAERYPDALNILQSGACLQLNHGQVTCGSELAMLFMDTLVKGSFPYDEEILGRLRDAYFSLFLQSFPGSHVKIYKAFPRIAIPLHLEDDHDMQKLSEALGAAKIRVEGCMSFLRAAIRWSAVSGSHKYGSPELHDMIAEYMYSESPEVDMSRVSYHFVRGRNPKKFASTLVNFMGKCYPGEDDLAIARAVLMYLSLGNMRDANLIMDEIKKLLKSEELEFPDSDLIQFIIYLLQTLERDALPLFRKLRQNYKSSIDIDPAINQLLDEIAERYFGVQRKQGIFGDIFKMMGDMPL